MTSQKIRQYLTLTCKTHIPKLLILIKLSIKIWQSYSPRPTHVLYQCAKFGDDRTSFNVIFDMCDVKHVKKAYAHMLVFYFSAISRDIDMSFIGYRKFSIFFL